MTYPWLSLLPRRKTGVLIELCRRPKIKEHIAGYIVGHSKSHLLLHRLDWNTFRLDGYTILRTKDVKKHRCFPHNSWPVKAIEEYKFRPCPLPEVALNNWSEIAAGISKKFPLLNVHCEIKYPDETQIGVLLKTTSRDLVINFLGFDAKWQGSSNIKLSQVTRIDFDQGYDRALFLSAPKI